MHKTAIITGASSGYGLAMAKAFKDAGFSVLITARSEQGLLRAQADTGADFFFVQDVTDYSGWGTAARLCRRHHRGCGRSGEQCGRRAFDPAD